MWPEGAGDALTKVKRPGLRPVLRGMPADRTARWAAPLMRRCTKARNVLQLPSQLVVIIEFFGGCNQQLSEPFVPVPVPSPPPSCPHPGGRSHVPLRAAAAGAAGADRRWWRASPQPACGLRPQPLPVPPAFACRDRAAAVPDRLILARAAARRVSLTRVRASPAAAGDAGRRPSPPDFSSARWRRRTGGCGRYSGCRRGSAAPRGPG